VNPISTLKKLIKSKPIVDEMESEVRQMNPSNWKTTMHGIIFGSLMLASIWVPHDWQAKVQATASAFAMMGLISAADASNLKK